MGRAIFEIYGGPNNERVNLLSPDYGYLVCNWRPPRPTMELGLEKNSFNGIEYPRSMVHNAATTTFTLNARNKTQDKLIADERKLNRLLQYANRYWTDSDEVNVPVRIKIKAKDELIARHGTIITAVYHDSSNPFSQPFASLTPVSTNLDVAITHDLFDPELVNYPEILPFTGLYTDDFGYLGFSWDSITLRDRSYKTTKFGISNYQSITGLTDIYLYDTSEVASEPYGVPYQLFSYSDWTYFGFNLGGNPDYVYEYGKFNNIVTHYQETGLPLTITFQYYDLASGWTTLDISSENTTTDNIMYQWDYPSLQEPVTVEGKEGWWIRGKVASGNETASVVAHDPYTAGFNHIAVPEYAIGDAGCKVEMNIDLIGDGWYRGGGLSGSIYHRYKPTKIFIGVGKNAPLVAPNYENAFVRSTVGPRRQTGVIDLGDRWDIEQYNNSGDITASLPSRPFGVQESRINPTRYRTYMHTSSLRDIPGYTSREDVSMGRVTLPLHGKYRVFCRVVMESNHLGVVSAATESGKLMYPIWARIGKRIMEDAPVMKWNDNIQVRKTTQRIEYPFKPGTILALDLGSTSFNGDHEVIDIRTDISRPGVLGVLEDSMFCIYDFIFLPDNEYFVELEFEHYHDGQSLKVVDGKRGTLDGWIYKDNESENLGPVLGFPNRRMQFDITEPSSMYFFTAREDQDARGILNSDFNLGFEVDATFTPLFLSAIGDLT